MEGDKEEDKWRRARLLIYGFNEAFSNTAASYLKVGDESMSAILFSTMSKGNLSHLSYIFHKPEQLRTEYKTVACSVTGSLIFLEIQRDKEGMKSSLYYMELGDTSACTKKLVEDTKGLGKRALKGPTMDCFLFDSWF